MIDLFKIGNPSKDATLQRIALGQGCHSIHSTPCKGQLRSVSAMHALPDMERMLLLYYTKS